MNLKNELEWDNDFVNIYSTCTGCDTLQISKITNHQWYDHNLLIPFELDSSYNHNLYFNLVSDSTLNYRGVEIDYLKVLFEPNGECSKGDVNLDSYINVVDIVNIVNFIFETDYPVLYKFCASDITEDGIINVLDVVTIVDSIFSN